MCPTTSRPFHYTAVPDQGPVITSSTAPVTSHHQSAKPIETRKTGRKFVRPLFEKLQSDVEMSEAASQEVDAQGIIAQQSVRKRLASATFDLSEGLPIPRETNTKVAIPVFKKS